jgi:hypothetical protein
VQPSTAALQVLPPSLQPSQAAAVEKPVTKPTVVVSTTIPATGFQFKRDWTNLNQQIEQQAMYFERIPPSSYKTLFSTGLDSSVFSRIILLWSKKTTIDEHMIDSLYELRRTPRFDTQLSFLDNHDKQLLKSILQRLQSQCSSVDRISTILNDYKSD